MDSLINECMNLDLEKIAKQNVNVKKSEKSRTSSSPKPKLAPNDKKKTQKNKKQSKATKPKEPKLNQKFKSSINPSKRHRDRLNLELENLSKLLPFSEDVIARLDKLSILRLSVSYLRNKNFYKGTKGGIQEKDIENLISKENANKDGQFRSFFNQALGGFFIVVTVDGELFYVSEKVKEYLGYSQSQVLHQSFVTLVHDDDQDEVATILKGSPTPKIVEVKENEPIDSIPEYEANDKDFVVRLKSALNTNTSDLYKPFRVCGSIRKLHIEPSVENLKYALFAFCTPARTDCSMLEVRIKTTLFCSKNRIDLSFLDLDARGKEFFGYSKKDIFGRSSYVLVHRQDLQHLRCKHSEIMTCGKSSVGSFRLMSKNNEWAWVCGYARVLYKNGKPDFLVTTNRIMSDEEGQAMLKIRDDADYKALERIGLIEPDDPAKALELGFPNRATSITNSLDTASDEPIPMPLASLLPTEMPPLYIDEGMDSPIIENFFESANDHSSNDMNKMMGTKEESLQLPVCNLSPQDFIPNNSSRMLPSSPVGSHISSHTNKTRGSMNSTSSIGEMNRINIYNMNTIKKEKDSACGGSNHDNQSLHSSSHSSTSQCGMQDDKASITELKAPTVNSSTHSPNERLQNEQNNYQDVFHNHPYKNMSNVNYDSNNVFTNIPQQANTLHNTFRNNEFDFFQNYRHEQNDLHQASLNRGEFSTANANNSMDFLESPNGVSVVPQTISPNVTLSSPEYANLNNMCQQAAIQEHLHRARMNNVQPRHFAPPYLDMNWMRHPSLEPNLPPQNMFTTPGSTVSGGSIQPAHNTSNNTIYSTSDFVQNPQQYPWL